MSVILQQSSVPDAVELMEKQDAKLGPADLDLSDRLLPFSSDISPHLCLRTGLNPSMRASRTKTGYSKPHLLLASAIFWFSAVACVLSACNAQVKAFSAVPRHICAGEPVQLQWNVAGAANVTVTPPSSGLPDGPVESEGPATITPTTRTLVALHVTRTLGSPTTSTQEIEVTTPTEKPEALTASMGDAKALPGCSSGKVWATVHVQHFAANVKVATVTAHPGDGRIYDVQHAGLHATVAPDASTTAFAGAPIEGDWVLTTPLSNGQTCATIPHNLVIDIITQCRPEQ